MSKQVVNIGSTEFIPKNEYLLVETEIIGEKTTASGIVIPDFKKSVVDRPTSGTVIEVGSDIEDIKPGDFILWPSTDGLDIEFNDGTFMLLRYKSVIGRKK